MLFAGTYETDQAQIMMKGQMSEHSAHGHAAAVGVADDVDLRKRQRVQHVQRRRAGLAGGRGRRAIVVDGGERLVQPGQPCAEFGGEPIDPETNTFPGTAFYGTVRELPGLRAFYAQAESGRFDPWRLGRAAGRPVIHVLRRLHSGLLGDYLSWCLVGLVVLMAVLVSGPLAAGLANDSGRVPTKRADIINLVECLDELLRGLSAIDKIGLNVRH